MIEFLQHVLNGLSLGAVYALLALGYTMVYGVLQLINFAHSEVFMLGAFAGFYSAESLTGGLPPWLRFVIVLAVAMVACASVGLLIERLAYRPLRNAPRLNSLITAIGVSMFIQAVGQLPWFMGPSPHFFASVIDNRTLELGGLSLTTLQIVTLVSSVLLMAVLHRLVFHTRMGTAMRAVSFDIRIAGLMGISADRVIALTFLLGSALAAAAGVLIGMGTGRIEPTMGVMLGLKAFVAAVLGGIGNIRGAMVGGLTIGLTESLVAGYGGSGFRDAVVFAILIGILVFKPAGIFGRVQAEKV